MEYQLNFPVIEAKLYIETLSWNVNSKQHNFFEGDMRHFHNVTFFLSKWKTEKMKKSNKNAVFCTMNI